MFDWPFYLHSPLNFTRKIAETLHLIYECAKKKKIVLLIDEFMELSGDTTKLKDVLSIIHALKDSYLDTPHSPFKFFTCITSLAKLKLNNETASQRSIIWYTLPHFNAVKFLQSSLQGKEISGKDVLIQKIANFCGNYPRGVVYCKDCWSKSLFQCNSVSEEEFFLKNIVGAAMQGLLNLYEAEFNVDDEQLVWYLVALKIWNLSVNNISTSTGTFDANWLSRNGFIFKNFVVYENPWDKTGRTEGVKAISAATISPIMLGAMLVNGSLMNQNTSSSSPNTSSNNA